MQRIGSIAATLGGTLVLASTIAALATIFVPSVAAIRDAVTIAILGGYVIAFVALSIAALVVTIDFFHMIRKKENVPIRRLIRLIWVLAFMSTGALAENVFMATRLAGADPWATVAIIALGVGSLLGVIALAMFYLRREKEQRLP